MPQSGDVQTVIDNTDANRFEITVDGSNAHLIYRRDGGRLVLVHTEVPEELSGRGVGGTLVAAAIEAAAESDLTVVPICPFARSWLRRHPATAGRVTIEWPEQ
jgi:uncharacterized protein